MFGKIPNSPINILSRGGFARVNQNPILPVSSINLQLPQIMPINRILAAALASGSLAMTAQAVVIYGLGSDSRLYSFDSATPGSVTNIGASTGLIDIDFHGVNRLLYGVSSSGSVFTVNTATGATSLVTTPLSALSGLMAMDFNPMADRIRLAGTGNFNARLTPDAQSPPTATQPNGTVTLDGTYSFFQSDGVTLRGGVSVLGVGYINPSDNPASTTLYSLSSDGFLNIHTSPAGAFGNGVLVGALGFVPVGAAFDIADDGNGPFLGSAYAYDGVNLQLVNLSTGAGSSQGAIGLPTGVSLVGLAVVPEPSSLLLGAAGGLFLLRRRRTV